MDDFNRSGQFQAAPAPNDFYVTVFDAVKAPYTVHLARNGKTVMTFGRAEDNDIILGSHLVSRHHGGDRRCDLYRNLYR